MERGTTTSGHEYYKDNIGNYHLYNIKINPYQAEKQAIALAQLLSADLALAVNTVTHYTFILNYDSPSPKYIKSYIHDLNERIGINESWKTIWDAESLQVNITLINPQCYNCYYRDRRTLRKNFEENNTPPFEIESLLNEYHMHKYV